MHAAYAVDDRLRPVEVLLLSFLAMGNFDYDRDRLDISQGWAAAPTADQVFDPAPDMAAQGQFYVRRAL